MTDEDLKRLHQNAFYLEAHEFFTDASIRLSEMLDEMNCSPTTPEQKRAIKLQCEKVKQARIVVEQLRGLILSTPGRSAPAVPSSMRV